MHVSKTTALSENNEEIFKDMVSRRAGYSLALDEGTDASDTTQLVGFIRGLTSKFEVIEEYLDMASMSSTTTGQYFSDELIDLMEKSKLNSSKWCVLKTDVLPSVTGKTNGFTNGFLDALGSRDVVAKPCIIQQENLCANVLGFAGVMNNCRPICELCSFTEIESSPV